jgi:hypothetical protein
VSGRRPGWPGACFYVPTCLPEHGVVCQGALETLTQKGVFDQTGPMYFELRTREGGYTHCGVREFVGEAGTIGLPAKVAACLGAVTTPDDEVAGAWATRVNVKYVRLQVRGAAHTHTRTRTRTPGRHHERTVVSVVPGHVCAGAVCGGGGGGSGGACRGRPPL